jgi:SAM-dependent methyltransferase
MTFMVNDGKSLDFISDHSLDFAFSFDSLVHAEADVVQAYVRQLSRKLKPAGVAFIHHSNAYHYRRRFAPGRMLPLGWRTRFMKFHLLPRDHMRAPSMSAERFAGFCDEAGCRCVSQELVNWGYLRDLDCLSIFTPKGSRWDREPRLISNPFFLEEARSYKRASALYTKWQSGSSPA